jgi:glycosyltransferase involved in cell wall biosynthesis
MPNNKMLILAYACSPFRGSEPAVGWNYVFNMSKHFELWVICREEIYKEEISRFFNENGPMPSLHFTFIKHSFIEKILLKSKVLYYLGYNFWHRRAYTIAKELHRCQGFSLSHMLVFCGIREPGYLWKLPIPFVWGPIGGVQNYPWKFLLQAGINGAISEGMRNVVNTLQIRLSGRIRKAMLKARIVMAANRLIAKELKSVFNINPLVQLETALPAKNQIVSSKEKNEGPFNLLWSGLFVHRKALHLLFMALAKMPENSRYVVRVIGKGPLEKKWRKLADKLKIAEHIQWTGWLTYKEALIQYKWADAFVFTSLRDTSGNVMLEALANGVPVIALDHQGAADIVTQECGIKVDPSDPRTAISGLRDAMVSLHNDRDKLDALSQGAVARAREFLWEESTGKMAIQYLTLLDN